MSLPKRVILPIFTQRMILNLINSNKKQSQNIVSTSTKLDNNFILKEKNNVPKPKSTN